MNLILQKAIFFEVVGAIAVVHAHELRGPTWPSLFWEQGNEFFGKASGDELGHSVALSNHGMRLAIGAPSPGDQGHAGYVKVHEGSSSWTLVGEDVEGAFGHSVALSANGKILAVGAPYYSSSQYENLGKVHLYCWDSSRSEYRAIDSVGVGANDVYGWSVDLSSDGLTVAIGATGDGDMPGYVRVYRWGGDLSSTSMSIIGDALLGDKDDVEFGWDVSLSPDGKSLAASSPFSDGSTGMVKIFRLSDGEFRKVGQTIFGENSGDKFGYGLALSGPGGETLAIGGPYGDPDDSGYVKVYRWNDNSSKYIQVGDTIRGGKGDILGWSVDLSEDGDTLAIGATGSADTGDRPGYVKVYKWQNGNWAAVGQKVVGDANGEEFGWSVGLSMDGSTLASGAVYSNVHGYDSGKTTVYTV